MRNCCSRIDDFLDGDLTAEDRAAWLALAKDCARCEEILKQQQQIDNELRSAWALVGPPRQCVSKPDRNTGASQISYSIAGGLAVAATIAITAFYLNHGVDRRDRDLPANDGVVAAPAPQPSFDRQDTGQSSEVVTVVSSSRGLVIPITSEPEFTLVRYVPAIISVRTLVSDETSDSNRGENP